MKRFLLILCFALFMTTTIFAKSATKMEPVYDDKGIQIGNEFTFDDGTKEILYFNTFEQSLSDDIGGLKHILDDMSGIINGKDVPSSTASSVPSTDYKPVDDTHKYYIKIGCYQYGNRYDYIIYGGDSIRLVNYSFIDNFHYFDFSHCSECFLNGTFCKLNNGFFSEKFLNNQFYFETNMYDFAQSLRNKGLNACNYKGFGVLGIPQIDDNGNPVIDDDGNYVWEIPPVSPSDDERNPSSDDFKNPNPYGGTDDNGNPLPVTYKLSDVDGIIPLLRYIANLIYYLPDKIKTDTKNASSDNLKYIFVPEDVLVTDQDGNQKKENYFTFEFNNMHQDFTNKVPSVGQVGTLFDNLSTTVQNYETDIVPETKISTSIELMGVNYPLDLNLLDLSFMSGSSVARQILHGVILLCAWLRFIIGLPNKLKRFIKG